MPNHWYSKDLGVTADENSGKLLCTLKVGNYFSTTFAF